MRLWSLHPKYLDSKGLVALWREGLLARKVLRGLTKGYRHHPQLQRFAEQHSPVLCIDSYLREVFDEAARRGFKFDRRKFGRRFTLTRINVSSGQLQYELEHLKKKLRKRDPKKLRLLRNITAPDHHPVFKAVRGEIEVWEKIFR